MRLSPLAPCSRTAHTYVYFIFIHLLKYTYHGVSTKFIVWCDEIPDKMFFNCHPFRSHTEHTPHHHYRQFTFLTCIIHLIFILRSLRALSCCCSQRQSRAWVNVRVGGRNLCLQFNERVEKYNLNFILITLDSCCSNTLYRYVLFNLTTLRCLCLNKNYTHSR